ncbi:RDD family protein [Halorarius halobius]|uniref:RDD family protein n=1 Tax=Halorarius halobius TaxID=2962671 RepID=UPI0020CD3907|nr:RDD family protein [Halorarius halobius]
MTSTDSQVKPTDGATEVVGERIGAQVIDLVLSFVQVVAVAVALAALVGPSPELVEPLVFVGALTLPLYGGVFEAFWNGQTPGKRALGIKVVDYRGETPGFGSALARNVPAVVVFSWLTAAVGLAAIAIDDRNQRLFDQVAGTYVVEASPGHASALSQSRSADSRESTTRPPR